MALLFRAASRTSAAAHRAVPRLLPLVDSSARRAASSSAVNPAAASGPVGSPSASPSSSASAAAAGAGAAVTAAAAAAAPSVADRVVHFTAIDTDGQRHAVAGLAGRTLLSALIRAKVESADRHQLEELDSCNGNCQVSIAQEWLDKLPPRSQAEEDRLRQVATDGRVVRSSRLGCQVHLNKDLEGMTVAMAEERPWYTL